MSDVNVRRGSVASEGVEISAPKAVELRASVLTLCRFAMLFVAINESRRFNSRGIFGVWPFNSGRADGD